MGQMGEAGWQQINAGLGLLVWSRLASWNPRNLTLVAAEQKSFESRVASVHPKFGRLICWIAFGVGTEYLVRGSFMLKGHDPSKSIDVIQPPEPGANVLDWIQRVKMREPSVRQPGVESSMKLGSDLPWTILLTDGSDLDLVSASMKLLAGKIRNRDAHRYTENQRAFHFHAVESLFVPALNILLACLDQDDLRINTITKRP